MSLLQCLNRSMRIDLFSYWILRSHAQKFVLNGFRPRKLSFTINFSDEKFRPKLYQNFLMANLFGHKELAEMCLNVGACQFLCCLTNTRTFIFCYEYWKWNHMCRLDWIEITRQTTDGLALHRIRWRVITNSSLQPALILKFKSWHISIAVPQCVNVS